MACWPAKGTKPTALAAQGFLLRIQAGTLFEKVRGVSRPWWRLAALPPRQLATVCLTLQVFTKSDAKAGRIVIPKV